MNHEKKKLLKEALLEAQLQEFLLYPSEEELDQTIVFSQRLQNYILNLASLADKKERKFIYLGFHPIRKAVAVFFILLLLSSPITVPAITKGIIQIIQLIKGDYVEIHHVIPQELLDTIPDEIVYSVEPTWLPQGYELQDQVIEVTSCYSMFTSPDKYPIHLYQSLIMDIGPSFDNEDTTLSEIQIQNSFPGLLTSKDGYSSLTWNDGYYQYQLIGPVSLEDIVKIANSMLVINK